MSFRTALIELRSDLLPGGWPGQPGMVAVSGWESAGGMMAADAYARRPPEAATRAGKPAPPGGGGDLTQDLLVSDWWTDAMVAAAGIPVVDVPLVTVGGGIGSFVTVDYLRIAGVTTDRIRVLSDIDVPWRTYEYLTRVSQIPRPERIRSDSASRPDNIWGFPSYALAEAFRDRNLKPLLQVLASRSGPTTTPRGPARGVRRARARGEPDRLCGHAGQRPGPDGTPSSRRRLLHDFDAAGRDAAAGSPTARSSCTWRWDTRA